jgi:glyoxylase-like metal-dependent hydrolase (beta-lactamase superfamily II)
MKVQRIECNPLQENCYVVSDESRECVIIDCGAFYDEECKAIGRYISENNLKPVHLLATHGHLDHNFGNAYVYRTYGLKPEICAEDEDLLAKLPLHARELFGMEITDEQPPIGRLLADGDVISFGTHQFTVVRTPGHSHGSALFYCEAEKMVFTGDTLFRMSIGRTDFPEGSWKEMENSLHRIAELLPHDTTVLPGHGPQTTIADELKYNPYLR